MAARSPRERPSLFDFGEDGDVVNAAPGLLACCSPPDKDRDDDVEDAVEAALVIAIIV